MSMKYLIKVENQKIVNKYTSCAENENAHIIEPGWQEITKDEFDLITDNLSFLFTKGKVMQDSNLINEAERLKLIDEYKHKILNLLRETDHKVLPDYDYLADQPVWLKYRGDLKNILKLLNAFTYAEISNLSLPVKPF